MLGASRRLAESGCVINDRSQLYTAHDWAHVAEEGVCRVAEK